MAATANIDTPELSRSIFELPIAADTHVFAGTLAAADSAGRVVPAADSNGLRVLGRAEAEVDNRDGAAGALGVLIKQGIFRFNNSETNAVDPDDVGKVCFVEDDLTVAETSTHKVVAGRVVNVDDDGVWVDTRYAGNVPSADTLTALTFSTDATGDEVAALRAAVLAILQAQALVK